MTRLHWLAASAGAALALSVTVLSGSMQSQSAPSPALTGTVMSKAEGAMEGVLVTAKSAASTMSTTVVTNADGRYSVPRNRLAPGKNTLTTRASGFELAAPATVDVTSDRAAQLDLTLIEVTDVNKLASHLTTVEWFQSMPGSEEQKGSFLRRAVNCGFCHTMEKVVRSRYTAEQWLPVIHRMASYEADHTGGEPEPRGRIQRIPPRPKDGRDFYGNTYDSWWGYPMSSVAQYLATINLSGGKKTWEYPLTRLPRPKGRETRTIVTVYPVPRRPSAIHDIAVDSKGNVWYGNSAWDYIGKLDPKTGMFSEWALPEKGKRASGVLDVQMDPEDNFWTVLNGRLAKFDTTAEKWTLFDQPAGIGCGGFFALPRPGLNTMWTGGSEGRANAPPAAGLCRFNIHTGKAEVFPLYDNAPPGPHRAYQTERDSKDNGYSLDWGAEWETPGQSHYVIRVDGKTKATKFFPTPTAKSFPRRGAMDAQDRFWFAEFWGDNIGMLDTKTEKIEEFPTGIKYLHPYFARPDKNGEVWVSNFTSDRVVRFNPKTKETSFYLMPWYYYSRKIVADPSTPNVTIWLGSKNTAEIIRVEALD